MEFEQVVGGHGEASFGSDGGSSAAVESADAAVVFGVAEDRLDDVLSLPVERGAVLGRQDVAHEVIDAAAPARPGRASKARLGPDQDRDAVAREALDLLGVPVTGISNNHFRELAHARGLELAPGRGDRPFEMSEVG